ncbi:MAG: anhydro-N-acetylmuramic acid kinase, partial [Chromatiales bacterium]|nr:anhydro-N-acetylmuramic acid kinase [Chromatiales bacterium]
LNLCGIANITVILTGKPDQSIGFDTGTANTLMDIWARQHLNTRYDENGSWAKSGTTEPALLEQLLADPYFSKPAPKSTGTEYFSRLWLAEKLKGYEHLAPADIQATLCAFSAETIANAIKRYAPNCKRVIACGGGVDNPTLMGQIETRLPNIPLQSSSEYGIHPSHIEGAAFAWLARRRLCGLPGNLPSVTGASHPVMLGTVFPGAKSTYK